MTTARSRTAWLDIPSVAVVHLWQPERQKLAQAEQDLGQEKREKDAAERRLQSLETDISTLERCVAAYVRPKNAPSTVQSRNIDLAITTFLAEAATYLRYGNIAQARQALDWYCRAAELGAHDAASAEPLRQLPRAR